MVEATNFTISGPAEDGSLAIVLTRYKFKISKSATFARERLSLVFAHGVSTRNYQDAFDGLDRLKELCPVIPVHCIFGERYDLM